MAVHKPAAGATGMKIPPTKQVRSLSSRIPAEQEQSYRLSVVTVLM